MLKLFIIAAIAVCANGYYNHGPPAHQPFYGNYGHVVSASPPVATVIPARSHHGSIYNAGYGGHIGAVPAHTKIIQATYPGAIHKSSNVHVSNSGAGYLNAGYAHGSIGHGTVPATSYIHAPPAIAPAVTAVAPLPYNHGAIGLAASAPAALSYNHGPAALGYAAHSRYAVSEGPTTYSAHSRYAIAPAPALTYSHSRYPIAVPAAAASPAHSGSIYPHALPIGHGIQKIAYNSAISHMGFQNHAAQSYAW